MFGCGVAASPSIYLSIGGGGTNIGLTARALKRKEVSDSSCLRLENRRRRSNIDSRVSRNDRDREPKALWDADDANACMLFEVLVVANSLRG